VIVLVRISFICRGL